MKQVASHFGGTRNALAISWPKRVRNSKKFRSQFHHVVDIFPTLLETAGIDTGVCKRNSSETNSRKEYVVFIR